MTSWSNISVVVPTFGDFDKWDEIAIGAVASAHRQRVPPVKVIRSHSDTLAKARNLGAVQTSTDWLIFLDADDRLDRGYVKGMYDSLQVAGTKDPNRIWRPATLGVVDGVEDDAPVMIPRRNLLDANFIVIGAMVNKARFLGVGGFRELPCLEDWDLYLRLVGVGATIIDVPDAVYRVTVRQDSRNQNANLHGKVYSELRRMYAKDRALYADQE